jgi:hypothetical protein
MGTYSKYIRPAFYILAALYFSYTLFAQDVKLYLFEKQWINIVILVYLMAMLVLIYRQARKY